MASWQAYATVLVLKATVKRKLRHATDPVSARLALESSAKGAARPPEFVGGIPGEWQGATDAPVTLLYLHGGGYFACSPRSHRPITRGLAQGGLRVFAPAYRLAPEHPYPAALEDAVAAYQGLRASGARRIVLAGDSAGGGLALALMLKLRALDLPMPDRAVLFSPWTDLAATGPSLKTNNRRCAMFWGDGIARAGAPYIGTADPRDPLISPLYGNMTGLPPLLIHVGEAEVLRDDSTRMAERARAAGVPVDLRIWPVVPHVWQIMPGFIPEARESLAIAARFLLMQTETVDA